MNSFILPLHGFLRWIVLGLAFWVFISFYHAIYAAKPYTQTYDRLAKFYLSFLHIQLLLGLFLYFYASPWIDFHMKNTEFSLWMKDPEIRYKMLEHPVTMFLGILLSQVGRIWGRRLGINTRRFKIEVLFYTLGLILIISRIPWG
ncbi:MAG: hypothetical protein OXB93_06005 [Cytophagales bacterium]|nr:hypothetical protein [Cytophagales bacterium]